MLTDKDPVSGEYKIPRIIYSDAYASEMVAYADLVPFYDEVEALIGLSGDREPIAGRKKPPLPPILHHPAAAIVEAGAWYSISLDYSIEECGCPGCIDQIEIGYAPGFTYKEDCAYSDNPPTCPATSPPRACRRVPARRS